MAVTADSVVIELEARTGAYTAAVNGAAGATSTAMTKIERSASRAEAQVVRSSALIANAQRNLGRQVADIGTQANSGQSLFLIIAQQAPQVADALADVGGKAGTVAAFFAGPWGAALLAAGSALALLAEGSLKTGESLDDLVKKLSDEATKSRLAADAQAIFERSLYGAADASASLNKRLQEQNRSQIQVAQSALAAAVALRQQNLQNLRTEASAAAIAQAAAAATAKRVSDPRLNGDETGAIAPGVAARAISELAAANQRLAVARRGVADSESAVVQASVPVLRLQAAEQADRSTAAVGRHERAVDGLTASYERAQRAASKLGGTAGNAARAEAVRRYRAGVAGADRQLASDQDAIRESNKKGPKGPSAETLARRAEVERVRGVRADEAFNTELETLNQQIVAARRSQTDDAEKLAAFDREAVQAELRKRIEQINADESAKKYDAAQAIALRAKAQEVAGLREAAIASTLAQRQADQQLSLATNGLRNAQQLAQAQGAVAETNEQRRDIELRLLRLKYDELRIEQQAALKRAQGRGDVTGASIAQANLNALPGLQTLEQAGVEQRYAGRYETYRRTIRGDFESTRETVENIEVRALDAVTDSLTDAATAALGLKGALGDVVGQLIRIGLQRRLIGPLADQLFGKADGSSSGAIGGFLSSIIGGIGGRASGGYVGPGQTVKVNEQRGPGVELLRMGSQGGTVIPLGQAAVAQSRGGTTVVNAPQFNLRGAIITRELYADMQRISNVSAAQAGQAAYQAALRDVPGSLTQRAQLK